VRGQRRGGSHIIKSKTKAQSKPFYLFKISLKMRSAASHRLVAKLKLLVKTKMEMEMQRCNRLCEKLYPAGFLWAQSLYAQLWLRLALLSALGCTSGRPTEGILCQSRLRSAFSASTPGSYGIRISSPLDRQLFTQAVAQQSFPYAGDPSSGKTASALERKGY